jgi:arginase family enzyme
MTEARGIVGQGATYVSYDIDFVDPAFAPGTGTPEIGGPTSWQALLAARLLRGVRIVGADLVEGFAALRSLGRHGLPWGVADVRNAVCDGRSGG